MSGQHRGLPFPRDPDMHILPSLKRVTMQGPPCPEDHGNHAWLEAMWAMESIGALKPTHPRFRSYLHLPYEA